MPTNDEQGCYNRLNQSTNFIQDYSEIKLPSRSVGFLPVVSKKDRTWCHSGVDKIFMTLTVYQVAIGYGNVCHQVECKIIFCCSSK